MARELRPGGPRSARAEDRRRARSVRRLADRQAGLRGGVPAGHRLVDAAQGVRRRRAVQRRLRHRRRGDPGGRSRLRHVDPRQRPRAHAGLVLRHRGAEAAVHRRRDRRHEQRVHRRLRGERAAPARRAARRTSTLPPSAARAWASRRRSTATTYVLNGTQVLAVQRRRLGQQGREPEPRRRAAPTRAAAAPSALSAIIVERGTPGVTYNNISTLGQRTAPNFEITFDNARVPAENMIEGAKGNGDLLINRNFAWSGPVAGIGAVAVARAAYEDALRVGQDLHRRRPEADHPLPVPGLRARRRGGEDRGGALLLLEDRALPRPARLPRRDARRDVQDPLHRDAVRLRVQVHAGRRASTRSTASTSSTATCARRPSCRSTTPGNFGMQRRRVHGVMADPSFNPRAVMDDEAIEFTKAMEGIDTIPGPTADDREAVSA